LFKFAKCQMSPNNILGAILIRENTLLPLDLAVETEAAFPGWRAVRNLDGYELGRKIQKANWNLFYLAGVIRTIAFGRAGQQTAHQAVRRILAKLKGQEFNCLEITGVIAKRFLGIPFLSVIANSRHIQEGLYLVSTEGLAPRVTAAAAPGSKLESGEKLHHAEVLVKQDAALA
jgi:hypothetical protein